MSRIFGRRSTSLKLMSPPNSMPLSEQENRDSSDNHQHDSAYSSLLDPMIRATEPPEHRRTKSTPGAWMQGFATSGQQDISHRTWLSAAARRPSWTGERPPPRKLVKDPNSSGRPSFSVELSDSDGEREKGVLRRQLTRLRSFYRREKPGP